MNFKDLQVLLDKKLISEQRHPIADLYIYNYTPLTQYKQHWDELTLACRGLIMDSNYNIKARPFKKFFNHEEHEAHEIPHEPFEVFEKMDGSLGILYWHDDMPYIASRGSFTSEQAIRGSQILHQKYAATFSKIDKNKTYLFEIIYPENKIVVDYGSMEELVLLCIIDTTSGETLPLESIGFPIVKKYDGINEISTLKHLALENKEGFVLYFKNGFRMKIKFEEYLRLHRIITNISNVDIWEHLSSGKTFDEILDNVPDEFYDWVKRTVQALQNNFEEIKQYCDTHFKILEDRKATAIYFKTLKYPSVLFAMLDGKDPSYIVWKLIKPKWSKPFFKITEY